MLLSHLVYYNNLLFMCISTYEFVPKIKQQSRNDKIFAIISGYIAFLDYFILKFIYSEKATNFFQIFTLLLSYVVPVKSKVKISQNFVAFSEYMNFILNIP